MTDHALAGEKKCEKKSCKKNSISTVSAEKSQRLAAEQRRSVLKGEHRENKHFDFSASLCDFSASSAFCI